MRLCLGSLSIRDLKFIKSGRFAGARGCFSEAFAAIYLEFGCSMRVMVTGGAGFIGSAVCRLLVREHGVAVVNVDRLTYAANPGSLSCIAKESVTPSRRRISVSAPLSIRSLKSISLTP